jgi:hypothetical protein
MGAGVSTRRLDEGLGFRVCGFGISHVFDGAHDGAVYDGAAYTYVVGLRVSECESERV